MISKKKNDLPKSESLTEQNEPSQASKTILAEGVLFKGDFEAGEPMLVYGTIEGNIKSTSDVVLSSTAKLEGTLDAENTTISGITEGDINCKNIIKMEEKGEIRGNVKASRFIMSEDAVFTGNLKVKKESK